MPNAFLFVLLPVALVLHVMLTRTVIGRHIVACGNDDRAAHLAGLNVTRIRVGLYMLSGVLAATRQRDFPVVVPGGPAGRRARAWSFCRSR